ncbi:MAG TPA: hypothetical protein VMR14_16230 [Streptosporangiaceae bacterium]|jgi:hypothetical protein|nr:hypothetical protein [Streptosporangiaceae bacterium]
MLAPLPRPGQVSVITVGPLLRPGPGFVIMLGRLPGPGRESVITPVMVITEKGPGHRDAGQLRDHANQVITEFRGAIVRSGIRDHDPGMITERSGGLTGLRDHGMGMITESRPGGACPGGSLASAIRAWA